MSWFKHILEEANGTPSSIRIGLGVAIFLAAFAVTYVLIAHFLTHEMTDLPAGVVSVINFTISALCGAKSVSKFAESPTRTERSPSPRDLTHED